MTSKISHIENPELLSALFTSAARVAVLRVFLIDPTRQYYQRQLESATGLAIRAVQRELDRMTEAGLLYRRLEGRRAYYAIDTGFSGFGALRELFLAEATRLELLRAQLAVDPRVVLAFNSDKGGVLVVTQDAFWDGAGLEDGQGNSLTVMSRDQFEVCLAETPEKLNMFLKSGEDVLGRREDIVWRRIEAAGFQVAKGKGVP